MTNLLLKNGADPNAKAKNGLAPIHLCSQEDRVNVAGSFFDAVIMWKILSCIGSVAFIEFRSSSSSEIGKIGPKF
jgi:ankyrin repeat protein